MTVEVIGKPGCGGCLATTRNLDSKGVTYTYRDLTLDAEAEAEARNLGYLRAPVVIVNGGETHWSGFRPDLIAELANVAQAA